MKVQIEIEIPDGHEVASTEVLANDYPLNCSYSGKMLLVKTRPAKPFLINGKPADWPEWLTCDWVSKDEDGEVWAYQFEPMKNSVGWYESKIGGDNLRNAIAIDIPGDWTQSKRQNPNRKK